MESIIQDIMMRKKCAHTASTGISWIQVDLGSKRTIEKSVQVAEILTIAPVPLHNQKVDT